MLITFVFFKMEFTIVRDTFLMEPLLPTLSCYGNVCCFITGQLESPKMTLDETVLLSKLTDTMRAQVGVLETELN